MGLGETLRSLRENSPRGRIRPSTVTREYGLSRQTLYLWESPHSKPEPVDLRRYCEWLGATEEQILDVLRLRSLSPDTATSSA